MKPSQFNIILIGSKYPRNIGAASRAMGNLGGDKLFLVNKKCELDLRARQGAAGSQGALENAVEYDSLDQLREKEENGIYIGLTRRLGQFRDTLSFSEVTSRISELERPNAPFYLVFGPEDHGLTSEELLNMNYTAYLPTYGDFETYNLAQAVLLTLYIAQEKFGKPKEYPRKDIATEIFPTELFRTWLESTGYDLSKNKNAASKLTKMIQRSVPSPKEVELLKAALHQSIRKTNHED